MNERTWLIIYVVIGWLTAIVIEIQCNRWKNKHDEAITAWTIESNNKDKQILKLQEELKNLKAEPVKRGRWISNGRDNDYNSYCRSSRCDHEIVMYRDSEKKPPNYCENCGADMRGEKNE